MGVSMQRVGHWLIYLAVRVCISIIQCVRIETCQYVASHAGWLLYDLGKVRRSVIDENLQTALPELTLDERAIVARRMWEHLLLLVCEIAHAPRKIHDSNYRKFVQLHGKQTMVRQMLSQGPKVVVTAHFGNFEFAGYLSGVLGLTTFTVARTLDNKYLDDFVNQFRELKGQFILPKMGSAPQADAVLKTGGALVLLGDQSAGKRGIWVEFMGRSASCHKALALFSLLNKAPMLVLYCRRRDKPLQFDFGVAGRYDPLAATPETSDVRGLTQWYNQCLEKEIRVAPHQYWWVHRRWKEAPSRRSAAKKPAAQDPLQHRPAA